MVGAPKMRDEAQAYYTALFQKVYDSAEWQDYMKKKALQGEFLSGDGLKSYWTENNARHVTMLKEIGEI